MTRSVTPAKADARTDWGVALGLNDSRFRGNDGVELEGIVPDDPRLANMPPDELQAAMRTLGYRTQSDLANAIGVSRSAVSLWLEGKVGVPRPVAMLLRMMVAAQRRPF